MPLSPQAADRKDQTRPSGTPTFRHQHFAWIASIIRNMPTHAPSLRDQRRSCALAFAIALQNTNPNFDRARFLSACGEE